MPSAPADDGNAAGAAWLAFQQDHPDWRPLRQVQSPYLGDEIQPSTLQNAIEHGGLRPVALHGKSVARHATELLAVPCAVAHGVVEVWPLKEPL